MSCMGAFQGEEGRKAKEKKKKKTARETRSRPIPPSLDPPLLPASRFEQLFIVCRRQVLVKAQARTWSGGDCMPTEGWKKRRGACRRAQEKRKATRSSRDVI